MVLLSALRRVIARYSVASLPSVPEDHIRAAYGQIKLTKFSFLFDMIDDHDLFPVVKSENPLPMESVGQVRYAYLILCLLSSFKILKWQNICYVTFLFYASDVWVCIVCIRVLRKKEWEFVVHTKGLALSSSVLL